MICLQMQNPLYRNHKINEQLFFIYLLRMSLHVKVSNRTPHLREL